MLGKNNTIQSCSQRHIVQGLIRHFRGEMEDRIGRAADQIAEQERRRIAA